MTDTKLSYLFRRKFGIGLSNHKANKVKVENDYNISYNNMVTTQSKEIMETEINDQNQNDELFCSQPNSICIYVKNNGKIRQKKTKKYKVYEFSKNELNFLFKAMDSETNSTVSKHHSALFIKENNTTNHAKKVQSTITVPENKNPYDQKFIVNNCCQMSCPPQSVCPFANMLRQTKVYRCQIGGKEETCCCSCNSDAMFEVMKSLYDCYKKKNCQNCNCVLCGPGIPGVKPTKSVAEGPAEGLPKPTPEEREKILKEKALAGEGLPEGKTESEKRQIQKIRSELGLPPEPKTSAEKERYKKAVAAGIITPLEGKTTSQKEVILRKMAEAGIALPEGRTASEKALIAKISEAKPKMKISKVSSARLRKAKEAGLITPLEGKTTEEKEKILRGLAKAGIPMPKPKTESEKKLIEKVKADLGLPPEPTTSKEKAKYEQAIKAGIITPLEGKTASQKEVILKKMVEAGVPLPEGRTSSEKKLIAKIKSKTPSKIPSAFVGVSEERIKKAKKEGLFTPLEGKSSKEKEKILKGLAKMGVPLPKPKTESERKIMEKVQAEMAEKPTEAKLYDIPSKKMKKAKEAGLITPLDGKSPEEKERILKGLAKIGIPLPEPKTESDKKIIEKVRADLGLPPEPKTSKEKQKYKKALEDGIITPLEGKTLAQKEEILRKMAAADVPLPEGRTPSEKALIAKIKGKPSAVPPTFIGVPSEKIRKAKEAGLVTPLEGKSPEEKERILKGLAKMGVPLPEPKTESERKIMEKIRSELALPPEPKTSKEKEKYKKAMEAGIVTPLEGKTQAQKEEILKKMVKAGVSLPKGRTSSERALIAQIKARPPSVAPSALLATPSERMKKAKEEGVITPLAGKTIEEKEKILKGLAKMGVPLPEPTTKSEKKLIEKVRADLGLPPEPKTSKEKAIYKKAMEEGVIIPLEGKTTAEKEAILTKMEKAGVTLPEGRTPSEKALIAKIKGKAPSVIPSVLVGISSKKMKIAKEEGLITPLAGKPIEEKERILKGLAKLNVPLPEPKTESEKKLIEKVRADLGLPPEPKTSKEKAIYKKAMEEGVIVPLEGKTTAEKEVILTKMAKAGVALPEGRTPSEKALIAKIKEKRPSAVPSAFVGIPSEKLKKAKEAGLITPLEGKSPEEKERILKGLVKVGAPLPEPKTESDKKIIEKVRADLGLPPEPKTSKEKQKYKKALEDGIITPLEGKTLAQKEEILRKMAAADVPLPEGRTPSEKALIAKIKGKPSAVPPTFIGVPSEKIRKAKEAGLVTPLEGKSPEEKERILKGLAKMGVPLPEPKTESERKIMEKIRSELALPPEPKTSKEKEKYKKAMEAGIVTPLEGKTQAQKEEILKKMVKAGVSLPKGRTSSERALIAQIKARPPSVAPSALLATPSERMKKAKEEGVITPLAGKTIEEKEKILKGLAKMGVPLPEPTSKSEKKLIEKVRADLGLPPEPKTSKEKAIYKKAMEEGVIVPLEGKTTAEKEAILTKMEKAGVTLPEGRTPSEKALIAKIKGKAPSVLPSAFAGLPSEKIRKAKEAGLITPLEKKSFEKREKILKGLVQQGIPLPAPKTESERLVIEKVRADLGLPPQPKTSAEKMMYEKAVKAGIITPLEGKTPSQKENALKKMAEAGVPLPEGRTPSEKAMIAKIKGRPSRPSALIGVSPEKLKEAKAAGLITPLAGKSPEEKERILKGLAKMGIPLPEPKTKSDKLIVQKVLDDLGLPPEPKTSAEREKYRTAFAAGIITPLEGKTASQKEVALRKMAEAGLPLPEGRTPSEKALIASVQAGPPKKIPSHLKGMPSEKFKKAKEAGLITPLAGKTVEEKKKILKGLAQMGIPLPEPKSASEKKLIESVRSELGLPPEPKTSTEKERYKKAAEAGIVTPLEGKTQAQKEEILRKMAKAGLTLPKGRTKSEKEIIAKIEASPLGIKSSELMRIPSEKLRKAKEDGLLTPLEGKTSKEKEKILKERVKMGIPLPAPRTESEKKLIEKVKADLGLPPEPKTSAEKMKYTTAMKAGIITPLEGKTAAQKEIILKKMVEAGVTLPEGRTPSEKALIAKFKPTPAEKIPSALVGLPSEKLKKAKEAGLFTPLEGKSSKEKEKILKEMAKMDIPLPEPKTSSEKKLLEKVRQDLGLPPEPKTSAEKAKYEKAMAEGIITPLEGKTTEEKEKILKKLEEAGIPLPEPKTASEKAIIAKIKGAPPEAVPSHFVGIPSKKLKEAKEAGLITPLEGKSPEEKERILKGLAKMGVPLPEPKTASEKLLMKKVRTELGLPPEPQTSAEKVKYKKAMEAGLITPLQGKTTAEKEKILQKLEAAGIPLPEPKTASEKAIIAKIKGAPSGPLPAHVVGIPSKKLREAKEAGLITPLEGKSPEEKERILKGLAKMGVPLPEPKTASEKILMKKVRTDLGLPPEPQTSAEKTKYKKAMEAGIITPLEGKTTAEKEKILKKLEEAGLPLPEPKTASEKALIAKIKGAPPEAIPEHLVGISSKKLKEAREAGLITPLEGKSPEEKERILKGLAKMGVPLPEPKTASEKILMKKVRTDLGLPPEPQTSAEKTKYKKAMEAGIITPLEGKTTAEKEKILKKLEEAGIPLPEPKTASEKALIAKIKGAPPEAIPEHLVGISSKKLKEAREAGLITPLEGKSPEEKERILKGLAKMGVPLPEPKTASEKILMKKVRTELGLPPEPQTSAEKVKYKKAMEAGLITPLQGKTTAEKEKILQKLEEAGIPLPEPKTASEKALIAKIKGAPPEAIPEHLVGVPSKKLKEAREAGLITPLEGKSPEEKERILKELAKMGVPLPEPKTASEKLLMKKVRTELGLPPEPQTSAEKVKYKKAMEAGLITPLQGKTTAEKEKILQKLEEAGIPLPEPKTASEKALIAKIKGAPPEAIPEHLVGISSKKLKEAREAGLITPLEGKSPEEKERILKGLAKMGVPLPEPKTASEKILMKKVRTDLGLPPEPQTSAEKTKYKKAMEAGIITPLEGKTTAEKEKILKRMADAGVQLPEGKTSSEKAIIAKIKGAPPEAVPSHVVGVPSKKLKEAKEAGLITPLEGKSPEEKERILKGLAKMGVPLPEPKTASEKLLMKKIKSDLGLPPEPQTSAEKTKYKQAMEAGIITPLEGKTTAEKEKILKRLVEAGVALPEGRTATEKALIAKVKASAAKAPSKAPSKPPSKVSIPPDKLRKAKEAGFITPLEGKTVEEKERILKGLAKMGVPLPDAKTESDKKLVDKVLADLGLPPKPKDAATDEKYKKAILAGIITPLEGKTPAQKEAILRKLADEDIVLPEGRTASEKAMITKIKNEVQMRKAKEQGLLTPLKGKTSAEKKRIVDGLTALGLPVPEGETPSEKQLVKKFKSEAAKKTLIEKGAGISEEVEEIVKTTKCDRACGCDKKKIRFKHSYVKIRVTSPDISSFCDCPEECLPGVKGGVFVDNEGIKVTVGRVTDVPSLASSLTKTSVYQNTSKKEKNYICMDPWKALIFDNASAPNENFMMVNSNNSYKKCIKSESADSISDHAGSDDSCRSRESLCIDCTEFGFKISDDQLITSNCENTSLSKSCINIQKSEMLNAIDSDTRLSKSSASYESILILETDSSVKLSSISGISDMATISVVSLLGSCYSENFEADEYRSGEDAEYSMQNEIDYYEFRIKSSHNNSKTENAENDYVSDSKGLMENNQIGDTFHQRQNIVLRCLPISLHKIGEVNLHKDPVTVINPTDDKILASTVTDIVTRIPMLNDSSVYVLVSSSDSEESIDDAPHLTTALNGTNLAAFNKDTTHEHQTFTSETSSKDTGNTSSYKNSTDTLQKYMMSTEQNKGNMSAGRQVQREQDSITDPLKTTREKQLGSVNEGTERRVCGTSTRKAKKLTAEFATNTATETHGPPVWVLQNFGKKARRFFRGKCCKGDRKTAQPPKPSEPLAASKTVEPSTPLAPSKPSAAPPLAGEKNDADAPKRNSQSHGQQANLCRACCVQGQAVGELGSNLQCKRCRRAGCPPQEPSEPEYEDPTQPGLEGGCCASCGEPLNDPSDGNDLQLDINIPPNEGNNVKGIQQQKETDKAKKNHGKKDIKCQCPPRMLTEKEEDQQRKMQGDPNVKKDLYKEPQQHDQLSNEGECCRGPGTCFTQTPWPELKRYECKGPLCSDEYEEYDFYGPDRYLSPCAKKEKEKAICPNCKKAKTLQEKISEETKELVKHLQGAINMMKDMKSKRRLSLHRTDRSTQYHPPSLPLRSKRVQHSPMPKRVIIIKRPILMTDQSIMCDPSYESCNNETTQTTATQSTSTTDDDDSIDDLMQQMDETAQLMSALAATPCPSCQSCRLYVDSEQSDSGCSDCSICSQQTQTTDPPCLKCRKVSSPPEISCECKEGRQAREQEQRSKNAVVKSGFSMKLLPKAPCINLLRLQDTSSQCEERFTCSDCQEAVDKDPMVADMSELLIIEALDVCEQKNSNLKMQNEGNEISLEDSTEQSTSSEGSDSLSESDDTEALTEELAAFDDIDYNKILELFQHFGSKHSLCDSNSDYIIYT